MSEDKEDFNALVIGACVLLIVGTITVLGLVKLVEIIF
jgi:hypothetical protein